MMTVEVRLAVNYLAEQGFVWIAVFSLDKETWGLLS